MSSGADNRGIFDDGSAQRLTVEAVSEMKGEGVSGQVRRVGGSGWMVGGGRGGWMGEEGGRE